MGQKGFSCEIYSCADSVPRDNTDGSEVLMACLGRFSSVMADSHTQVQAHTTGIWYLQHILSSWMEYLF